MARCPTRRRCSTESSVFVAVLDTYGPRFAVGAPISFATVVILGEPHAPGLGVGHIHEVAGPHLLAGVVGHLLFGFVAATFTVVVGSPGWWRHVLAVGGPSAALAASACAARRLVGRIEHRVEAGPIATLVRRVHLSDLVPARGLLDQLLAALLVAPDAPLLRFALPADRSARSGPSISRRAA